MVKSVLKKKSVSKALALGVKAGVPHLIFMTDAARAPDPFRVCQHLPAGSIIICRDYDHVDRLGFAAALRKITRAQQQFLLVAGDGALAREVDADGLHLPGYMLASPPKLTGFGLVSAACHTRMDLRRAEQLALDFALVSPVFATASHPGGVGLGIHRFARMIKGINMSVAALGGINHNNAAQLKPLSLMGIGAVGAFVP